jgi:hypothetical protein
MGGLEAPIPDFSGDLCDSRILGYHVIADGEHRTTPAPRAMVISFLDL